MFAEPSVSCKNRGASMKTNLKKVHNMGKTPVFKNQIVLKKLLVTTYRKNPMSGEK